MLPEQTAIQRPLAVTTSWWHSSTLTLKGVHADVAGLDDTTHICDAGRSKGLCPGQHAPDQIADLRTYEGP